MTGTATLHPYSLICRFEATLRANCFGDEYIQWPFKALNSCWVMSGCSINAHGHLIGHFGVLVHLLQMRIPTKDKFKQIGKVIFLWFHALVCYFMLYYIIIHSRGCRISQGCVLRIIITHFTAHLATFFVGLLVKPPYVAKELCKRILWGPKR